MRNDRFNAEGYPDPVPYEAMKEGRRFMPLIYICSKHGGEGADAAKARGYCRYAADMGRIPVAPRLLFPQFMSEEKEGDDILFMGIVLLSKCREVWVFGEELSEGMLGEIRYAERHGKPVRYFSGKECREIWERAGQGGAPGAGCGGRG